MRAMLILLVTAICIFTTTPAHAEEITFPKLKTCIEQCDQAFDSLIQCHQEEYERQDARLNAAYKNLSNGLEPELKQHLINSQRAWITFKEEYSSFVYGGPYAGQIQRLNALYWLIRATASWADDLENTN